MKSTLSFSKKKWKTFQFTCPICTATFESSTTEFADRHANRCIEQHEKTQVGVQCLDLSPGKRSNVFQQPSRNKLLSSSTESHFIETQNIFQNGSMLSKLERNETGLETHQITTQNIFQNGSMLSKLERNETGLETYQIITQNIFQNAVLLPSSALNQKESFLQKYNTFQLETKNYGHSTTEEGSSLLRPSSLSSEWSFLQPPMASTTGIDLPVSTTPPSSEPFQKTGRFSSEQNTLLKNLKRSASTISTTKKKICPNYKWIPNTTFTVDAFSFGEIPHCSAYFLTHFHADHYGGLSGKFNYAPLYCSQITANLVRLKFKIKDDFLCPLPLNTWLTLQGVEVMCIEANHCPGAIMIIFKVKQKTYLHTGDFRATPQLLDAVLPHHPFDCVFLDTTYLNPDYVFPPQSFILSLFGELTNRIARNLAIVLKNPKAKKGETLWNTLTCLPQIKDDPFLPSPLTVHPQLHSKKLYPDPVRHLLVVVGTYTIGKEKLAFELCRRLNSSLHCSKAKHEIFRCCFDESLYTPDPLRAQIHLVPMHQLNPELLQSYLDRFDDFFSHLLALRPTGWTSDKSTTLHHLSDIQPTCISDKVALVNVPYSEHSSFEELKRFVLGLSIQRIEPTVRTTNHHFLNHWQLEKRKNGGPQPWPLDS